MNDDLADSNSNNSDNRINKPKSDKLSDDVPRQIVNVRGISDILSGYGVCALLISDPVNLRYLSGFTGGEGYLFISECNTYLVVDSRYGVRAREECTGNAYADKAGFAGGRNIEIIVDNERIKAINKLIKEHFDKDHINHIKKDNIKKNNIKKNNINDLLPRIMLEGKHVTYDIYKKLSKELDAEIVMCGDEIERLRIIKTPAEISLIKKAEDIGCSAFEHILSYIRPGVSERDITLELEYYMKKNGAEALSFETIVASGVNSSCPHASVSDRKIENGDFVTLDFGCIYQGYCSDMTRTVAVGHINDRQKKIYDTVLSAQLSALENIRAGMTGREADACARNIIDEAGFGKNFGHGTGHGVGLYIHELPRVSQSSEDVLDIGMVFSVEPGIYIDGECGVRIEDVVTLTENGLVNLTEAPKELIII